MKKMTLVLALLLMLLCACSPAVTPTESGSAAPPPSVEGDKVWKFAIVFNGPVNDGGWNLTAWQGLEKLKEVYGDQVEITYSEKVDQADYEDTFYGYAKDGYDMVIANGFEFSDAALRVAEEFPEVKFGIINGLEYRDNVCGLEYDNVELGYVCGVTAGIYAREAGENVAFIGIEEIPSYVNFYSGFIAGIERVAPEVEVKDFYTGDWSDITKTSEMANTAISAGYRVIVPWVGAVNHAVYTVVAEHGLKFLQTSKEMDPDEYKDNIILNVDQSGTELIFQGAESCIKGEFPSNGKIFGNLSNGINLINRWGETMDEGMKEEANAIFDELKAGKITLPEKIMG